MSTAAAQPAPGSARTPKSRRVLIKSRSRNRRRRGLTGQQAAYLLGLLKGKSKRRAALDAGYSPWVADSAAQDVEGKRRGRFSIMRQFVEMLSTEAAN